MRLRPTRFCDHVVCDLEHLYRHIKSRDDLTMSPVRLNIFSYTTAEAPVQICEIGMVRNAFAFCKYCRTCAFLPTTAMAALFVQHMLHGLSESFRKYFLTHCCRAKQVSGQELHIPLFYCGDGSHARAGHGPSQNTAEEAINILKHVVDSKPLSEIELLQKLQERYRPTTTARTSIHGFLGPSQQLAFSPIAVHQTSPDLLDGDGRNWKSLGEQVWHPSAASILKAHQKTQSSIVAVGQKYHVLRRFKCASSRYTVHAQDAADLARMMSAQSLESLQEAWKAARILVPADDGQQRMDFARATHFFWEPELDYALSLAPSEPYKPEALAVCAGFMISLHFLGPHGRCLPSGRQNLLLLQPVSRYKRMWPCSGCSPVQKNKSCARACPNSPGSKGNGQRTGQRPRRACKTIAGMAQS